MSQATKFVKIFSTDANDAYPDSSLPTVLVYHKGGISKQYVGLDEWGGARVSAKHIEWQLGKLGAIEGSQLLEDPFESTGEATGGRSDSQDDY